MAEKGEYDVLRLIEHNQVCYISSGCIRGTLLTRWLKYHRSMDKREFIRMVRLLVKQLDNIHKCRKKKFYQYVNPCSIIVGEDGNVSFLDLGVASNEEALQKMRRRNIREYFLPPDEPCYQRASVKLDIYGFGRTLQYLLSEVELEPKLTRIEERKFKKIISRCLERQSKQAFQTISEVQKYLPEQNKQKDTKQGKSRRFGLPLAGAAVAALILAGSFKGCGASREEEAAEKETQARQESQTGKEVDKEDGTRKLYMELGLLCLAELKDYERGREYFQQAKGAPLAEEMELLSRTFQGEAVEEEQLRIALKEIEAQIPETEEALYYSCLLKGYRSLDGEEDLEAVIRIGELCLETGQEKEQAQILGIIAEAMEKSGQSEKALEMYERQLQVEEGELEREELYKKMAILMTSVGQGAEASEKLDVGIGEFPESKELRILYLRELLRASGENRELCLQTINRFLQELPELEQEGEFQKLMREYGMKAEGGKAWSEEAGT